jgi:hypothetical protein
LESSIRADCEIRVYCRSGQDFYIATRILLQNGFKAKNISGGKFFLAQSDLMTGSGEAAPRPCSKRARSALLEAHVLAVRNCSAS